MDTIDDTQAMPSLEQKVISNFDKVRGALEPQWIPVNVLEEISFFLRSPDVSPTCSVNTNLAFQLGKLSASMHGRAALLVEIIWLCVKAKDMYIKGVFVPAVVDCVNRADRLLSISEDWRIADLY